MKLTQHVKEMKSLAHQLIPYSFPVTTSEDEEAISCLKQREITIDGYDLIVYFNKCRYSDVDITMESLQIFGKYFSFLPFTMVCHIAKQFLGDEGLSFIEVVHNKGQSGTTDEVEDCRKIYVWTVYYDNEGKRLHNPFVDNIKDRQYEGWQFSQIDRSHFTFF